MNDGTAVQGMGKSARAFDAEHCVEAAISAYQQVLKGAADDQVSRCRLIQLMCETSRYEMATLIAEEGLAISVTAPVLAAYAEVHQAQYRLDEALSAAKQAVHLDPHCGTAWHALVTTRGLMGHARAQEDALSTGLARCPDHVELMVEWATRATQSPRQQLDALNALRQDYPHHRGCWFNQVILLSTVGPRALAHEARLEFIHVNPRNHQALAVHAMHLYVEGDLAAAERYARDALSLWPHSVFALYTLFQVHFLRDELPLAEAVLTLVHGLTLGTSIHSAFVTQMMVSLGDHERAVACIQTQIDRQSDNLEFRIALAQTEETIGRRPQALARATTLVTADSCRYDLMSLMARNLVELSRFEEAEPWVRRLDEGPERALMLTRIEVSRLDDADAIRQVYAEHLRAYPVLDFAWGILFRDAVETASIETIMQLTQAPYDVPLFVQHAALAYAQATRGAFHHARTHLDEIRVLGRVDVRWVWAWEFVLETTEYAALAEYGPGFGHAAMMDGYIAD
ncbi:MAG: hypothetical protein VX589_07360 [Myxococcota bacterium]|nr:hypothetical protein [Myxococcota bacterium]